MSRHWKTAEHTSGPWRAQREDAGDSIDYSILPPNEACTVARVSDDLLDDGELTKVHANARLIAAAPDLLKAGRAAYDMLCIAVDTNGGDSTTHSGCENLRKAIEKALEGGST